MASVTQIDTELTMTYNLNMAERVSMNVSLTSELANFVKSRVDTGRYQSDSEVVRQGLRLLQEHEVAFYSLREKIARGIEQADCGELIDSKEVLNNLKKRSSSRRS